MFARVPFSASNEWIADCFTQSLSRPCSDYSTTSLGGDGDSKVFQVLLPLLDHESVVSAQHYECQVRKILTGIAGPHRGMASFPVRSLDSLLKGGAHFVGQRLELRSIGVNISTLNGFTRDFEPPSAARAKKAISHLLEHTYSHLAARRLIAPALAFYFIFLTIHPFLDGNGRVARHYFASCISKTNEPVICLLALILLHQRASAGFHLACKMARMGCLQQAFDRYSEAVELASSAFRNEILSLADELGSKASGNERVLEHAMRIRLRAQLYLSG